MSETSVRLLRLLALLQSRPIWSGAELAERLGVTTRTVRNDIERLRIIGYRIDSTTGTAGGYRLGAGGVLPPLLLDDEEAVAVAIGLHAAMAGTVGGIEETALRALAKLQQMLPSRLRHRVASLRSATVAVTGRGPTVDAETLTRIAAAVRDRERLRFDYRSHDGTTGRREVEPHRLVFTGYRWYLLAWDGARDDWRTFRADRIDLRTPNGPRFTPRPVPDDPVAHVLRGTASTAWRHPARVRLHVPYEDMAARLPPAAGLLTPDGEHTILETGSDSLDNQAAFLGSLGVPFTVLDPPELRAHLRVLAARYAAAAEETPGS
ncbi:helix-turn-helix transcriptional regulator [Thermomonospora cellulosilytica]|uniref:Putative DNA-binding transcriptional regulator YafY n=1 Tax=Thermomonospora cellulosilytica TaxID=1411118 RepID=A0A7W3MUX6_9ACTN|nr:YafY family protein [Thermomonospora cellulosilytica]MBA9002360.1 putative DNA-binding transcriptional regulator YafY [Thermomonospora cellulosilytica]